MNVPFPVQYHSILIDTVTGAVLTTGTFPAALIFLKECTPDTWVAQSVNHPNYIGSFLPMPFFLAALDPEDYPLWTWNDKTRTFLKTKKELVTDRLRERSRLVEAKRDVITKMMAHISLSRSSLMTGVNFQDQVYLMKRMQAKAFKDSGYDEDLLMECRYVLQFADHAGISPRQAADDILLKAKFDEEFLMKSEFLRLKYFDAVRKATAPEQLPGILDEFNRVAYLNARI